MNFEDAGEPRQLLTPPVKTEALPTVTRLPVAVRRFFSARRKIISFGFRPKNFVVHRIWNIAVSLVILACVLPVFAVLIPLILIQNGWPVFYVGERIGKFGVPFKIFKFRTLKTEAEKKIGATVVASDSELITPIGRVLRDTRLDELPQLFNVLRGDMNMIGPRPVRRVIFEENENRIKNYNVRFQVKPGLLGHTQIFFPHGTSKAIRARYNNILVNRDASLLGEAALIAFSALTSFKLIIGHILRKAKSPRFESAADAAIHSRVIFSPAKFNLEENSKVIDDPVTVKVINSKDLTIVSRYPLQGGQISGHVFVRKPKGGTVRVGINANIQNWVRRTANKSEPYSYDATYRTKSDFGRFMIDRHVLFLAFAK